MVWNLRHSQKRREIMFVVARKRTKHNEGSVHVRCARMEMPGMREGERWGWIGDGSRMGVGRTFLMIMTRNGSLMPRVLLGSLGHVIYVVLTLVPARTGSVMKRLIG